MLQINLIVGSRYPIDRKKIRSCAVTFLQKHHVDHAQVDISVVGLRKIKELNESKLNHEGSTDVLSFPLHERHQIEDFPLPSGIPPHLGDVVVSFPEAIKQAKRFGRLVDDQLSFYVEHGLLHLLGYHHQ